MTSKQKENEKRFKRKNKPITYNPIRPLDCPDHERSFLGDTAVTSNVIGEENDEILGMFCCDAK